MRLYESKIQESVDEFHGLYADPTPEEYEQAKHMLWSLHQDRFFDTLKGYHKVVMSRAAEETDALTQRLSKCVG